MRKIATLSSVVLVMLVSAVNFNVQYTSPETVNNVTIHGGEMKKFGISEGSGPILQSGGDQIVAVLISLNQSNLCNFPFLATRYHICA